MIDTIQPNNPEHLSRYEDINKSDDKWKRDSLQFPRLISEILATQDINYDLLAESMNLTIEQVKELFSRADVTWELIKKEP
jgi:hypothetical protein